MAEIAEVIAEIDARISAARDNLRDLLEQAAAYSGAADDDLLGHLIGMREHHHMTR